jgi:hypothetical protein
LENTTSGPNVPSIALGPNDPAAMGPPRTPRTGRSR